MKPENFSVTPFGENGWLAKLSGGDMLKTALRVNAVADKLRTRPGVLDSVAGIDSLVMRYDPARLSPEAAKRCVHEYLSAPAQEKSPPPDRIVIPVCYGGAHGPDFDQLSTQLSLSRDALIKTHSAHIYRVLTIGFAPGFAYIGPLPAILQTGRLKTPRTHVPAGSVGVAGAMTGIYPLASPGGWALIGRTPKRLFDPHAPHPFLFAPGAEVQFTAIDEATFAAMQAEAQ